MPSRLCVRRNLASGPLSTYLRSSRDWVLGEPGRRATGGGSGTGRSTCGRLAEVDRHVSAIDIDGDAAAKAAKEPDDVGRAEPAVLRRKCKVTSELVDTQQIGGALHLAISST